LSQMMKRTRSIVRIEKGATPETKVFSTKEFFPRIHPIESIGAEVVTSDRLVMTMQS